MPTLQDLRTSIPELNGLDDSTAVEYIRRVHYPDRTAEEIGSRLGVKPVAPPSKPRSGFAAINDTVIDFSNAVAGGVSSIGNFVAPGNRVSRFIQDDIIQAGRANQSDATRAEDARYAQEMEAAQGMGDEAMATLGYVGRNPIRSLATAAGSFVGPAAGITAAKLAARGLGAGGAGAVRAGMAGGALTGAALSGGDAAGTAYDLVMKAGGSEADAVAAARNASVIPAAIGGLGGVVGAERLMAGAKGFAGGRAAQALKTGAVEAGQEAVEEGVTQYEGQRAAMPFDQTIDPMKGVAGAATMGAVLGAATGGGLAALKPQVPEVGPLSRAANVAPPPAEPPAPPPSVPLTPQQEKILLARANIRAQELAEKTKGVKDAKGPDGEVVPGKMPEFLTPQEKAEADFLKQSGGDAQALARAYPGLTAVPPNTYEEAGRQTSAVVPPNAGVQTPAVEPFSPASGPLPHKVGDGSARAQREADKPAEPTGEPMPGDILNKQDKPFTTMPGAMGAMKRAGGDSYEIVRVAKGLVVRPKAGTPGAAVRERPAPPPRQFDPAQPVEYGSMKTRGALENYRAAVAKSRDDMEAKGYTGKAEEWAGIIENIDRAIAAADEAPPIPAVSSGSKAAQPEQAENPPLDAADRRLPPLDAAPAQQTPASSTDAQAPVQKAVESVQVAPAGDMPDRQGLRAEDRRLRDLDSNASELAGQMQSDVQEDDFDPAEVLPAMRKWAEDAKIPADDLRQAVIKRLSGKDIDLKASQRRKLLAALKLTEQPAQAQPVEPMPASDQQVPAVARPNRRTKAVEAKAKEAEAQRADYFSPGNIVKGYGGFDEVLRYDPPDANGRWNVRVRRVVKQGDEWVPAKEGGRDADPRNHSTRPDEKELKAGPVRRAPTQEQANAAESADQSARLHFDSAANGAAPKVYKTRRAAEEARTGNTQRLRKTKDGYILRDATDKELAAAEKAGRRLAGGSVDVTKDSLLVAIAKLGGLHMNERSDTIGEGNRNIGGKMLFTTGGQALDTLADGALREYGYVPQQEVDRDGGVRWLRDAIKAEFNGGRMHYSEQGMEAIMQREQAQQEAEFLASREAEDVFGDLDADEVQASGYTAASPEIQAMTERLVAEAEALGVDVESIRERVSMASDGKTQDEYEFAVQQAIIEAVEGTRSDAARRDTSPTAGSSEDRGQVAGDQGQEEGLTLEAQDAEGLRTRADREARAVADDAKEQRRLADKAKADAERDEFTLTGSDRAVDVGVAAGQGGLFDGPAEPAPLYASRPLTPASANAIRAWAASQGFKTTLPAADMHVTVAYSREPVDGAAVPADAKALTVPAGKRTVEPLGDQGAVVLKFDSPALQARWKQYREAGASWDYENYTPHVTLTYDGAGVDLKAVKPYTGPIELAAETQEPLNLDKADDYKEAGEDPTPEAAADASADEAPQLTEAQARKQFEWRDLGQKDGVKTHMLFWFEKPEDKGTGSAMGRVQVTRYAGSSGWQIDGEGEKYPSLSDAKQAAVEVGMRMNREQGWINPESQAAADKPAAEVQAPKAEGLAPMPAIGGISMALAQQAHSGTSFVPERRAEQERDSFKGALRDAWERAARVAGTDQAAIDRIREVFQDVAEGYQARYTATLQARSRVMSSMIAGPARFPVERNRKRMETERKRAEEASEYLERGIKRLLRAARGPIDNSPESELERVRLNLSQREEQQELMKAANAALRKDDDAALEDLGFTAEQIADLKKGSKWDRGFPAYRLTNNNAEIRRLRERLTSAEERMAAAQAGPIEAERPGVKIVEDATDDRLRLLFDGKPDEAVREDLKANGFRWSPRANAWQRQLTDNARYAAKQVLDKHFPAAPAADDGNAPMYSRTGAAPDEAAALQALSENDDLFALPKSEATTLREIGLDIAPQIVVSKAPTMAGTSETWNITMPTGEVGKLYVRKPNPFGPTVYGFDLNEGEITGAYEGRPGTNPDDVDPDTEDVYIDVSKLQPGQGGNQVYAIAATYAHNTGRIFIGDPAGLSDDAMRRRSENMLSSALRYGTTRHLAPHPRQEAGANSIGVPPLRWTYGDDLGNIRRLIDVNVKALENAFPAAKKIDFDADTGQFRNADTGAVLDRATIERAARERRRGVDERLAGTGVAGVAGVQSALRGASAGGSTIARGAVWLALSREEGTAGQGSGRRDGLLVRLAQLGAQSVPGLNRLFSRPAAGATTPAQLRTALEAEFSPETISALERAGLLFITDTPGPAIPSDVAGLHSGGKIALYADNTAPGSTATLYHEALHATLKASVGEATYTALMERLGRIDRLAQSGGAVQRFFKEAAGRIPADTRPEARLEELASYAVEQYQVARESMPFAIKRWVGDLIAALRAGLVKALNAAGVGVRVRARLLADPSTLWRVARDGLTMMARQGMQGGMEPAFSRTDQAATEAFKRWFAGSKVVDAQGRPLVVYHGTAGDFDTFERGITQTTDDAETPGWHFSESQKVAADYAREANDKALWKSEGELFRMNGGIGPLEGDEDAVAAMTPKSAANIMPVYLKIERPLVIKSLAENARLEGGDGRWRTDLIARARRLHKYDGIILERGVGDSGFREYIAFKPEQIKSATGNSGAFNPANPDIRYSRTMGAALTDGAFTVKGKTAGTLAHYRSMGMQLLGRRQIIDLWSEDLPSLTQYGKFVELMDAEKNDTAAEADELANTWGKLPDEAKLAELMHDATLARFDADPEVTPDPEGTTATPAEQARLKRAFKALTPEAQATYRKARDTYSAHHNKVRLAIRERIERSELSPKRRQELLKKMDGEFFKKVQGVYFPLARFGNYVVVVRDAAGEAVSVTRAETVNEADAARAELLKAFPKDKGFNVGKVLKDKEFNAARDGVGRGFMAELFETLEKEGADESLQDTIGQLYLAALPDLSWAKHGIHRKGTAGFSQDARRAFAQNVFHGGRYLAKLRYADRLQGLIGKMQNEVDSQRENEDFDSVKAQQVVDEMVKRHDLLMNPNNNAISTALTSIGFVFHLGLSPASALVNLTQTALVAYPQMAAKWGYGKASAALLQASKEAASGRNDISKNLSGDELAAYQEAVRTGTIDVTQAHDLAGISQGEDAKVTWALRPVMKWASFMFHHAERFNRQVTFVAAYRLAREAGADHLAGIEQATKATYDGHYDYSAGNRPRLMQDNVMKVVLLFKQFAQNTIYTISRQAYLAMKAETPAQRAESRKALGGLLAMHAAAAGGLGLPMVSTLLAAASFLGGSDDEPWDAEAALRNMLADTFGKTAADVMARGVSRLTPWDISGRVGLDKLLLPDIQEGLEGTRAAEAWMASALGPVAGIAIGAVRGLSEIGKGEVQRGFESMAPSALRGPLKALRYSQEGAVDKTGIQLVDEVSPAAIAGQALGLSSTDVRNATEGKAAIYHHDRALQDRRSTLLRQYAQAFMVGDKEAVQELRDDISQFNKKNPSRSIKPQQMRQSVANRRKRIEQADQGVYLPKNRRDAMEAGAFAIP